MDGKPNRLAAEASRGHVGCINILMKNRKQKKKWVSEALIAAVKAKEIKSVEVFARLGADVNASHNRTIPVKEAVNHGYYKILQELVKAGADVNKAFAGGMSPLRAAVEKGYHGTVNVLLKSGADVNLHQGEHSIKNSC